MADGSDAQHLALMQALEGFNETFFESYLTLAPDGEYIDTEGQTAAAADEGEAYMAVQPAWLDQQYEKLKKQPWFRQKPYGRAEAEDELVHRSVGTFIVRVSSQAGNYAISVVRPGPKIDHMLILPSFAGANSTAPGLTQYRIGSYSTDLFNTVPRLIAYYVAHPYFEKEKLVGVVLPEDQEGGLYFDTRPLRS